MSCDAKAWQDGTGWLSWKGLHDGPCNSPLPHDQGDDLQGLLASLEGCLLRRLRWELHTYPDGSLGLRGFEA